MKYRSLKNRARAVRGGQLIRSHPDYGRACGGEVDELITAASNLVALGPEDILSRALHTYQGDFEDEPL
jgi:hypothetical protein